MSTTNQTVETWAHEDIRTLDKIVDGCAKAKGIKDAKTNLKWIQQDPKLLAKALSKEGLRVEDELSGSQRCIRFIPSYTWYVTKITTTAEE